MAYSHNVRGDTSEMGQAKSRNLQCNLTARGIPQSPFPATGPDTLPLPGPTRSPLARTSQRTTTC